ncbi:MAG: virulence RhuM family protein [Pelagibacterales bacterium]|nr:virulence RhuM family protein [Pelagibacterales bacterium]
MPQNNQESQNSSQILIYESHDGKIKIDVALNQETVWLNQEQMAILFGKAKSTINEHIKNIYEEGELKEYDSMQKFGNSEFQQKATNYYNLDVIISVGYRVKSKQGTQFRIWATNLLKEYIVKGFALNDERFKSGNSMNYFDELQERIREIRISERFFYQKIKDIYKTSIDYDAKDEKTVEFFKIVQNKLLWAISKQTAAEIVFKRSDANSPFMGMKSIDKKLEKSITKKDSEIAKNYLSEDELKLLGLIVEQYLAFAQTMASQRIPMYMKDWIKRLDEILRLNGREILEHAGKISHKEAIEKAGEEYKEFKQQQKEIEKQESLKELENDLKKIKNL